MSQSSPRPFTEFPVPTWIDGPAFITNGPDGALWFTEGGASKIGRITVQGQLSEFALPDNSEPARITTGPDGALWFTDIGADKIGRITAQGQISQFPLSANSGPLGITAGPDGALWFTEAFTN